MGNKDSDPSASVLDLGEDDLPEFSTAFDAVASGASDGDSDSGPDAECMEQLLYWEVRMRQEWAQLSGTADAAYVSQCNYRTCLTLQSISAHHQQLFLPCSSQPFLLSSNAFLSRAVKQMSLTSRLKASW